MLRASVCSVAALALFAFVVVAADKDNKANNAKKKTHQATITKVDAKSGTVTVRMKDKSGKEVTRTFKLTEDIRYVDSTGKAAAIDVFRSGDKVLVVEEEGHLKEIHKNKNKSGSKTGTQGSKPSGK